MGAGSLFEKLCYEARTVTQASRQDSTSARDQGHSCQPGLTSARTSEKLTEGIPKCPSVDPPPPIGGALSPTGINILTFWPALPVGSEEALSKRARRHAHPVLESGRCLQIRG